MYEKKMLKLSFTGTMSFSEQIGYAMDGTIFQTNERNVNYNSYLNATILNV